MTQINSTAEITFDADLTALNTLGIAAKAQKLIEITSVNQLKQLHKDGLFEKEQPFILGGGSNILLRRNISRTVLKISLVGITVLSEDERYALVDVSAGVNWHSLVEWAVENNFGGIENLALIPGTVGAAPIQNIGAYGVELKDVIESVTFFDLESGMNQTLTNRECSFGYRDSIFKNELKGKVIVTGICLKLTKPPHTVNSSYRSLSEFLQNKQITDPGIDDIFDAVVAIRESKLPNPNLIGNAGSFFKNPIVERTLFEALTETFPDIPGYEVSKSQVKIPAGWLIEKAGWKGKKVGNVGTYKNQALVLVNYGGATGEELWNHALRIQKSVSETFGVELTPEVNIIE